MGNSTILAVLIGTFLIVNLLVGLWAGKGVKTVEEYEVGKSKWSTGSLSMTYLATILGGGMAYRDALSFYTIGIMAFFSMASISISHFIRAFFLSNQAPLFAECRSLGDFIEKLYGKYARYFVGILSFVYGCLVVGLQIRVLSFFFSDFIGWDPYTATIFSGLVITIYTAFGGMKAVIATDIFQFIMMFGALFVLAAYAVWRAGGVVEMAQSLPTKLLKFGESTDISICWSLVLLEVLFSYEMAEPARFQRLLMAKDKSKFRKLFIYSGIGNFIGFGLVCLASFSVAAIVGENSEIANPILYVTKNFVPNIFIPIVNIGIIAIVLSSGDSWLHTTGCGFSRDLVEPVLKRKISIVQIKLIVFIMGLISIWIAFKGQILFFNLGTLLSVMAPVVSVPVFLGFMGMKTSKNMFWGSAVAAITTFILIKFLATSYMPLNLIISTSVSFVAYIIIHIYENKCIKMVGNPVFSHLDRFATNKINIFSYFSDPIDKFPFMIFGILNLFTHSTPYLFGYEVDLLSEDLFYFRGIGILMSAFLITHSVWPTALRKYSNIIIHASIIYCIPFLNTVFFIKSPESTSSIVAISISLISIFLLIHWRTAIFLWVIGIILATLYSSIYYSDSLIYINLKALYILLSQGIAALIFCGLLSRRRDKYSFTLKSQTKFLELIQTNSISSAHKSMSLQKREESQFNHFISLPSAKEKINEIIKNYTESIAENDLNHDLVQLAEIIESEERTKIYQVLSAKKHILSELSYKCQEAIEVAGCEDISTNIFTKKDYIRCDDTVILKMIYKIASDYCKKILSSNSGDDSDLVLSFFDTKILYESDEENSGKKLFSRTIDGIAIVISERDINKENKIIKNIYTKKLTDLEAIASSNEEDINFIDIDKGIDAHYGLLENHSDSDYLTWVCVIPADVYEIRPETLDMTEPINIKYNWPAAVELEKKFVNELQNFKDLNMSKVEYAVSVIKKYHFHQTRKSGEPYYMHPINVAIIILDIIKESNTGIYEELHKNIENLVIAALLHDILEDTAYSRRALTRNFGPKVRDLVLAVTKIDHTNRAAMLSNKQAFQDLIDKDPLSLCIKLADRLHNILTIDGHPKIEKRKSVAQETLDFFVPPAENYGLKKLARELKTMSEYILKNGKLEGRKIDLD